MIKSKKTWTTKEVRYLLDNHKSITMKMAMDYLGRNMKSVKGKVEYLGIKLSSHWDIDEYMLYDMHDNIIGQGTVYEIAEQTGINVKQIKTYVNPSIQKRLKRGLVKISE